MTSQKLTGLPEFSALCLNTPPESIADLAASIQHILGVQAGFWQRQTTWQALDTALHAAAHLPVSLTAPLTTWENQAVAWLPLTPTLAISLTPDPELGAAHIVWQALFQAQLLRLVADEGAPTAGLLRELPVGVLVCDVATQQVLWSNPLAQPLCGPGAQSPRFIDAQGNPLSADQHPLAQLSADHSATSEIALQDANGATLDFLASARLLDERRAVLVLQDIGLWRRREAERDNAIAAIAHDLKNPLTTIRGSAELLLRRAVSEERTQRELTRLQTIIEQADRMRDFLGTLVDVARLHSGELGLVKHALDLRQLLERTIKARNSSMPTPRIQCTLNSVPPVEGDQIWLERVIENLLDNALKYSAADTLVQVHLAAAAQWVEVTIQDEGIGIPSDELERIFEQFARGSNSHTRSHGSGLGLYTVRAVISAHAGTIHARSDGIDQGSTFLIRLPSAATIPA